ncbi:MAG TPA: gephyrin-like molybdotransferase Glp [Planctomycetota bacterium]|nr:gephyrin-like molybdotransferase Glp [Planctomycetota bacterium]
MKTVQEALEIILAEAPPPRPVDVPLAEALGHALAEEVVSDADVPPFDRAMMDGYAVRSEDSGPREVIEEVPAGRVPSRAVVAGTCAKIMTGAPLPPGADAVQQVEKVVREGTRVTLLEPVRPGQNVTPRGRELRRGDRVLGPGRRIGPAEAGALAAAGRARVRVYARPRVALLVTGDELVPPGEVPGPGKIRNSNSFSLAAQVRELGLACDDLGVVGDDPEALRARIREGLRRDLLVISGGVSAGDRDFVIPALEAEGVRIRLHQVRIRPGRPFCFAPGVFGLPGNPVSSFVIFEIFVRPYLGRTMGLDLSRPRVAARLETSVDRPNERAQFLPAEIRFEGAGYRARTVPWAGSADLFALTRANGFLIVPPGATYEAGALVECVLL